MRLRFSRDFSNHTPDTVLKLVVFGSVDEWIDAAVGEHQYHGEVVEPTDRQLHEAGYKKGFDLYSNDILQECVILLTDS